MYLLRKIYHLMQHVYTWRLSTARPGGCNRSFILTRLTCFVRRLHWYSTTLRRSALGLIALSLTTELPAFSEETIRLATRVDLPPYVEKQARSGIEIDLVTAIFKKIGKKIEFVQLPRIRMIQSFDNAAIDGILTQNVTVSEVGCATDWYLQHQNVALSLADTDLVVADLLDIRNLSTISFDGATKYLGKNFRDAVSQNPRYIESPDQANHIKLVYNKRFDIVVGDRRILRLAQSAYFKKTGDYKELKTHYIMPPSLYHARFHDKAMCTEFNQALQKLKETGVYAEITSRYDNPIVASIHRR
ncbi:MAG: hypothetical protein COB37_06070 [Kordiimonadales bacterium]|nr:MAG: hypothetical protein COB37_06070 [Kordiimonadales bacterium]